MLQDTFSESIGNVILFLIAVLLYLLYDTHAHYVRLDITRVNRDNSLEYFESFTELAQCDVSSCKRLQSLDIFASLSCVDLF